MLQRTPMKDAADVPRGLVYVTDAEPGIRREKRGKGWSFIGPDGARIAGRAERERILSLGIPPAWTKVWICPREDGHLQATGYDARGRKQYRYHPHWSNWRSERKFSQLLDFGQALGRVRRRTARDLDQDEAGEMEFALAALVTLIDRAGVRVGHPGYTAENRTYGATTLLKRHLDFDGDAIRLEYKAKGGKVAVHTLRGKRLQAIFHQIGDLPGRRLFTWIDADGEVHPVHSNQVNAYLEDISGVPGATAKTFRTWAGSVAALEAALRDPEAASIKAMCAAASRSLCNTPAICRSSYVHPSVIALAETTVQDRAAKLGALGDDGPSDLRAGEKRLLNLLKSEQETA